MKLPKDVIERWHLACIEGIEIEDGKEVECSGIDFADGLGINRFVEEEGERVIYFEEGVAAYLASAYRMGEKDGDMEKDIIEYLYECGIDFEKGEK